MQTSGRFVLTAEDGVSAGVPWGPRAVLYHRGPQPPGDPVPVCGLLGTGPHSGRGAASEASSAAPHRSTSLALPPEPSHLPPSPSVEKLSSSKPVLGARKVGDCCFIALRTSVTGY